MGQYLMNQILFGIKTYPLGKSREHIWPVISTRYSCKELFRVDFRLFCCVFETGEKAERFPLRVAVVLVDHRVHELTKTRRYVE